MTSEEKKAQLLLKSVLFHYHGLDAEEEKNLRETAQSLDAEDELRWVSEFISQDYISAFDRARLYLSQIIGDLPHEHRVDYVKMVWEANHLKGFVTELEAAAMLKLARDWKVEDVLIKLLKKGKPGKG